MIKWQLINFLELFEGDAEVSLDVTGSSQAAVLQWSGDRELVETARSAFRGASGAFGHLISSADEPVSAIDADYVLRATTGFDVEIIEGAKILAKGYDTGIPEDALS